MREVTIASRWPLILPEHRAQRPEWPHWERERLDAMHKAIRPTDTVYYVGMEEGDLAGLVAQWCGGRIHLFEPNDRVWPNARVIWTANLLDGPAGCWSGFAGDTTEMHSAAWPPDAVWPASAYGPVIGDHGFCQLGERPDLPRIRLDDYADGTGNPPDVITMDVEGSELRVLRGADRLLREERPLVFVSVHPESMALHYGDYENELHHYMAGLGYEGAWLAHDHESHYLFQHPSTARLGVTPREVYPL